MNTKEPILYKALRPIAVFVMKVIYNLQIENNEVIPKEGRIILAGNHKFYFDPGCCITSTKRVVHHLCWHKYYYQHEFFYKHTGTIVVEQHDHGRSIDSAVNYLNEDKVINISPEGSMNKTSDLLLPFRKGAILMAQRSNSKIIPYAISGDYKFRSNNLKVTFGSPIDVSKMEFEDANKLLYEKIKELLIKANQQNLNK